MKLNPDCIRDILLVTEELENYLISENNIPEQLAVYPLAEITYHANQCNQRNYFSGYKIYIDHSIYISNLSPDGHIMIANIRESSAFGKLKKLLSEKGLPFTLEAIKTVIGLLN